MTLALFDEDIEHNLPMSGKEKPTDDLQDVSASYSESIPLDFSSISSSQGWLNELALWHLVNHSVGAWRSLVEHFGSAMLAVQATPIDWKPLGLHASHIKRLTEWHAKGREYQRYQQTVAALERGEFQLLYEAMPEYPQLLSRIFEPPPILFYKGNLQCLNQPQLAMVGTRKPSPSARKIAFDFARSLAQSGIWVTSGLAQGIDADCHRGALAAGGGRTIAVLGTGIDLCYPSNHQSLYEQIIHDGGIILSEFLPKTEPLAHHFPRRNRIVSGLSLGVLVVEGALKSGSLITARLAAEQGRDVLVVPGHIDNEQAAGCHQLIRDGARLVASVADILEDLNLSRNPLLSTQFAPEIAPPVTPAISLDPHLVPIMAFLDWQGQSMDALVESSGMDVATLSGLLMELELLGQVVQVNGLYQRCRV